MEELRPKLTLLVIGQVFFLHLTEFVIKLSLSGESEFAQFKLCHLLTAEDVMQPLVNKTHHRPRDCSEATSSFCLSEKPPRVLIVRSDSAFTDVHHLP